MYEDLHPNKGKFDFSGYPENSKICNPTNKKVIDKMKDEAKVVQIVEFGELKAKIYSFIKEDIKKHKVKGY